MWRSYVKFFTLSMTLCVLSLWAQNPKTAVYPGGTVTDSDLGVQMNHVQTTLAASMASNATTVAVNSCTGFLTQSYVAIESEIAMLCGCSAGTMSFGKSSCPNVDGRGLDGTAAASHASAVSVFGYIVAGNHNQLAAELKALEAQLATPSAIRTKTCILVFGDPGAASSALASDNDAPGVCENTLGVNWTVTGVSCKADAGATTVNPILTGGSATSLLTAAITCGTSLTAGTVNGSPVVHSLSANAATCAVTPCTVDANIATADGVTKYLVLVITGSY